MFRLAASRVESRAGDGEKRRGVLGEFELAGVDLLVADPVAIAGADALGPELAASHHEGLQLLVVLGVDSPDVADRGDAEREQVVGALDRVALEIAVQHPVLASAGELVMREGEVVHAQVLVAGAVEDRHGTPEERELLLRSGQGVALAIEARLGDAQPGDVGVGVERDPVGPNPQRRFERSLVPGGVQPRDDNVLLDVRLSARQPRRFKIPDGPEEDPRS